MSRPSRNVKSDVPKTTVVGGSDNCRRFGRKSVFSSELDKLFKAIDSLPTDKICSGVESRRLLIATLRRAFERGINPNHLPDVFRRLGYVMPKGLVTRLQTEHRRTASLRVSQVQQQEPAGEVTDAASPFPSDAHAGAGLPDSTPAPDDVAGSVQNDADAGQLATDASNEEPVPRPVATEVGERNTLPEPALATADLPSRSNRRFPTDHLRVPRNSKKQASAAPSPS